MICPACENDIGKKKVCNKCGYDIKVYDKAKKISINFYNRGLNLIKNGCISEGIKLVEKSIEFDKRNIEARNLLGLSYMYLGKTGDSLKQWVLSVNIKKENNLASEYIEEAQKNKVKLTKYDEAITMYNEALVFMREKNEDVAIIRLKKAIFISENFLEAYKLLVLCYIIQNNYEKAMYFLDKANKIDYNNEELVNYYRMLNPDSSIIKQNSMMEKQKVQKVYMKPKTNPAVNKKKLATSMSILFGVIFVAVMLAGMIFSMISSNELNKLKADNKKYEAQIAEYEKKVQDANKELNSAKDVIGSLKDEKSSTDQTKFLNQADELFKSGNVDQAAVKIKEINKTTLDENQKVRYDAIYNGTIPGVSKKYYTEGKKFFDANKYDDAIINLEKSFYYSTAEQFSDDALYYAGLSYEKKGDKAKALANMERISKDYKDSDKVEKATKYIADNKK